VIQSARTGKWVASYKWVKPDWELTWADTKDSAGRFTRDIIRILHKDGTIDGCKFFRGEWKDRMAPDGVVSLGKRKVRKNGVVSFAGYKFRHDKLIPFVGQHIFVEADDYWITHPHAFKTSSCSADKGNHICDLDAASG
jgi:hypothetical protein